MKVDIHSHTIFSDDSFNTLSRFTKVVKKRGLDCIAVTDHNEIEGATQIEKLADFKVIIGEEILTTEGEIIGLFLKKQIPPLMDLANTINAIKAQHGLVYLPHPHKMDEEKITEHIDAIDIIEVYNGRNLKKKHNLFAKNLAKKYQKAAAAGSDSHTPFEIGRTYFEMDDYKDQNDFLDKLRKGVVFTYKFSYIRIFLNRILLNNKVRKLLRFFLRMNQK